MSADAKNEPVTTEPSSIFTKNEKWFIVTLTAFAGLFSPLTSNVYLPVLPVLTHVFNRSTELINLTVTMYIIMQGIAPMVWGPVSDRVGRRPMFLICLLILSLTCVGLALVPTNAYWLLMVLRCVQAAGSASTIAIGAGVISDISTRKERGGFFGFFILGPMIGPSIGPVIGGVLTSRFGWRSIFWFLCIASSFCFLIMVLFLPETLRSLVGDGSVIPLRLYRPIIPLLQPEQQARLQSVSPPNPFPNPLRLLTHVDIIVLLLLAGLVCGVYYCFITTISTLFVVSYPSLDQTQLGLCFLATGGGMALGTSLHGKLLDWDYAKLTRDLGQAKDDDGFPIEKARLRTLPWLTVILAGCSVGYGWCIEKQVHISAPLIIQFVVGYVSIAVMNSAQTLMIDLFPREGSSITACNNLIRCSLSAFLVSVIDLIIHGIGAQWTFTLVGGISLFTLPLLYLEMRIGPRFRRRRQIVV